jgi:hypothetical protein
MSRGGCSGRRSRELVSIEVSAVVQNLPYSEPDAHATRCAFRFVHDAGRDVRDVSLDRHKTALDFDLERCRFVAALLLEVAFEALFQLTFARHSSPALHILVFVAFSYELLLEYLLDGHLLYLRVDDIYDSRKFVSNTRLSGDRV